MRRMVCVDVGDDGDVNHLLRYWRLVVVVLDRLKQKIPFVFSTTTDCTIGDVYRLAFANY